MGCSQRQRRVDMAKISIKLLGDRAVRLLKIVFQDSWSTLELPIPEAAVCLPVFS